jgi:hypothetical protein
MEETEIRRARAHLLGLVGPARVVGQLLPAVLDLLLETVARERRVRALELGPDVVGEEVVGVLLERRRRPPLAVRHEQRVVGPAAVRLGGQVPGERPPL